MTDEKRLAMLKWRDGIVAVSYTHLDVYKRQTDSSSKKSLNKIGLYNVNQRICLTYGEEYAIHIDSKVGCFTKVTVRIPAQNAAGEAQK